MSIRAKSRFGRLIIISFALFCLLIADVYIFSHRRNGFNLKREDYRSFYYLADIPAIAGFNILSNNRLEVKLGGISAEKWQIISDDSFTTASDTKNPIIELRENIHTYEIISTDKDETKSTAAILKIGYTPGHTYEAYDNPTGDAVHLINSSLPVGQVSRHSRGDFIYRPEFFAADDNQKGVAILDSLGVFDIEETEERIRLVGSYLIASLKDKGGVPAGYMNHISPMQQLDSALAGKSRVWCANYQKIYVYLATLAGVPTRPVETTGKLDGVILSGHAFAESFIVEKGQWAYIDMSSGKIFIKNKDGDFINVLDLFHAHIARNIGRFQALIYDDSGLVTRPYREFADVEKYYFTPDAVFVFPLVRKNPTAFSTRIYRYIFEPNPVYTLAGFGVKYNLKLALLILTAVAVAAWCGSGLRILRLKRRRKA